MKKMIVWMALLMLCVGVLTGCQGAPLPQGVDEDTILAAGEALVEQICAEDYAAVVAALREDVREGVTEAAVRDLCGPALEEAGAFRKIEARRASGQQIDGEDYAQVILIARHEHDRVVYRFAFDAEEQFTGLSLQVE